MGSKLHAMRLRRNMTLRDVEGQSYCFAAEQRNAAYRISASWLNRLERGTHDLSLSKLILFAHIYRMSPEQLLRITHPEDRSALPDWHFWSPNATMLLTPSLSDDQARHLLQSLPPTDDLPAQTRLLSTKEQTPAEAHFLKGVIGRDDCFLNPMVPPGSVVLIDTKQKTFASERQRQSEFHRPIYFLLTHESYICGWCDFEKTSDWLTIIPHPLSGTSSQRWKYRRDIENLGRVVVVTVPWGRQSPESSNPV